MRYVRPIVKRVAKWLGYGIFALAVLLFIGVRWGLTPLPKPPRGVCIEPLRPPLKLEDIKADNAAYYYLQAAKQIKDYKQPKESEEQMDALLAGDLSGNTKAIEQTLADCAEAVQLVRKGTSMKFCQMPMLSLAEESSLGDMARWRRLARFLCCAGELARRGGNYELARDECLTVVKFGRDCATGGPVIQMFVGNAISGMGTKALRTLMLENPLPPETSKTVAAELTRLETDFPPLAETLRYELIYSKQMFDSNSMTNISASSRAAFRGTTDRVFDAAYGDMIQEAQKPYWQSETKKVLRKWQLSGKGLLLSMFNRPIPRMLVSMMLPGLEMSFSRATRCEVDLRATAIVCALTGYSHVHGEPPVRLEQLVPDFMPAVPLDPFDGKPLRYRREVAGWVVWSVGSDMKDDNAAWHEFKYRKRGEERKGGDIFFKSTETEDDVTEFKAKAKTGTE